MVPSQKTQHIRIVALLTCRNESLYLERCLSHLYEQGIETCFIDNDSTDASLEIAESYKDKGVFRIERQPYRGYFNLVEQLELKQKLIQEIDANWFIHHDADEIREAPTPFKTLYEGIIDADIKGYNAINFDEFIFLPTTEDENFENSDYYNEMSYYYFFEPSRNRRINSFKKLSIPFDIVSSGGHEVKFEGIKIYPVNFILRHYIVLGKKHAINKFTKERIYSSSEIKDRGWHGSRATFTASKLCFPNKENLKNIKSGEWDKSEAWEKHTFLEGRNR